jgi:hypothetical protein
MLFLGLRPEVNTKLFFASATTLVLKMEFIVIFYQRLKPIHQMNLRIILQNRYQCRNEIGLLFKIVQDIHSTATL